MRRSVLAVGASVTLAVWFMAAAPAQDRPDPPKEGEKPAAPEPATPAAPQEKVEIPGIIDSWYKVLISDVHVGYMHEVLQRSAPAPVRFEYNVLAEVETEVSDPQDTSRMVPSMVSIKVHARLDDTYAPIDMEWRLNKDGVEVVSTVIQTERGRRLEVLLPDNTRKSFPVKSEVDLYYSTHLMFVAMRQNDVLSKAGLHGAKVFYPRIDEAPVADVSFEVRDWVQREYLGKKVAVTRIDWVKPLPSASRDAEIMETYVDRYGRVVEEVSRGGMKILLVAGEDEAVGQASRIRLSGRRDPFRKDLVFVTKPKDVGATGAGVKAGDIPRVDKVDDGIVEVEKLLEKLAEAVERKVIEDQRSLYDKIIRMIIQLRDLAAKEPDQQVRIRVEGLKKRVEELYHGSEKLLEQARRHYVRGMEAFEKEDVPAMEKEIGEIKKLAEAPEFVGDERLTTVRAMVLELEPLLGRCKTRLELAKKKLELTGVVLHFEEKPQTMEIPLNVFGHTVGAPHELRFIRATHFAIINGKNYKVGDTVEGEGVRVERIRKYSVQVSLKEETREVGIRQ